MQQWAQVFVSFVESSAFRYSGPTYSEISPGFNQEPLLVLGNSVTVFSAAITDLLSSVWLRFSPSVQLLSQLALIGEISIKMHTRALFSLFF